MNTLNEPTIEDIKRMADEKRKTRAQPVAAKKTRQPRQKKVEPEPEPVEPEIEELEEEEEDVEPVKTKKQAVKKQIAKPKKSKKVMVVEDDESDDDEDEEEIEIEPIVYKKQLKTQQKSHNNLEAFKDIYESLNNIKDLISSQKEVIIDAIKPKVPVEEPKKKKTKAKKAKKVVKTLDLTVSDKEVEQIVSGNKTVPQAGDAKLQAFLNAFKK